MSKHNIIKFDPTVLAKFADWFGPPAVLTNEKLQIYKNMLCGVYNDVKPQGFIECTLVEDLAYNLFRRLQLRERKANVRRQVHNEKFERQERELVQDAERRKQEVRRIFDVYGPVRRHPGGRDPLTDTKFAIELEINEHRMKKQLAEIDAETKEKLAEVQKAKEAPIDEAAYFDQWIGKEERINEEEAQVEQNIRITFKLLDEHRTGLGQRLRQVADEIVEGEFAEVVAPAREEAADRAESACSTKTTTALTEPTTTPSTVAEFPLPALVKTNGGGLTNLDAPAASVPPPRSSPAEQRELKE
jgi:hypothetical protein